MQKKCQYGIKELPTQIIVGNVSLKNETENQYFNISAYLVLNSGFDSIKNFENSILYFDYYLNNWNIVENIEQPYDIFPSIRIDDGYGNTYIPMNGFMNDYSGRPQFIYPYTYDKFFYNKEVSKWIFGHDVKTNNNHYSEYDRIELIGSDNIFDFSYTDPTPIKVISSLNEIDYEKVILPQIQGSMTTLSSYIIFRETNIPSGEIKGTILYEKPHYERITSPTILSGPACLGYYGSIEEPYVIGSIVLGTGTSQNDIQLIGSTSVENDYDLIGRKDIFSSRSPIYFTTDNNYVENAYWWIGTTFNNGTPYHLVKVLTDDFDLDSEGNETIYADYKLFLVKGKTNNPFRSKEIWYCTNYTQEVNESPFTANIGQLNFTAYPSGQNISLNIVGLIDKNVDVLKYGSLIGEQDIYIGNWVSPQVVWS